MFGTNGLIIWLLGGAGTFLLYSSISNQKPQDVIAKYLGSPTKNPTPISTWTDPNAKSLSGGEAIGAQAAGAVAFDPNGNQVTLPAAYKNTPQTHVTTSNA